MTDQLIPFRKRRTYLDECRERGVFQKNEELRAENAELTSQLKNLAKDASADLFRLGDRSATSSAYGDALDACRQEMRTRTILFFEAFERVGLGTNYLPLLKHILVETDLPGETAEQLFRSAVGQKRKPDGQR